MPNDKLSFDEIQNLPRQLPDWQIDSAKQTLTKDYKFKNFRSCFSFMTEVALIAEKLNHHPTWTNTYNQLNITLTSHDITSLSHRDLKMAQMLDKIT